MNVKKQLCPICHAQMQRTEYYNEIYKTFNYFCSCCDSFHIVDQFNDEEYYTNQYHDNFRYKLNLFKYKMIRVLPFFAYRSTSRFDFLKKYILLPKKVDILEIGGGTGEHFIVFNRRAHVNSYKLIEPGPVMKTQHSKLKHIKEIFENVNIKDISNTNVVMLFHVMEHIFDLDSFFKKIKKTGLKYFYFEVPNIANEEVKIKSMTDNPHYHHFSKKSIRLLMDRYGFKEIQLQGVEPKSYHPYKHVPLFNKYLLRLFHKNEIYQMKKGIYLRGIYSYEKPGIK